MSIQNENALIIFFFFRLVVSLLCPVLTYNTMYLREDIQKSALKTFSILRSSVKLVDNLMLWSKDLQAYSKCWSNIFQSNSYTFKPLNKNKRKYKNLVYFLLIFDNIKYSKLTYFLHFIYTSIYFLFLGIAMSCF